MASLKGIAINAVKAMKVAIGGLAIDVTLKKRTQGDYVPGQSVLYAATSVKSKGVITKYRRSEIDGIMVQARDVIVIMFPPDSKVIPETNDIVSDGTNDFRVIRNDPMFIGSEIAFNVL
jgi:hypothetical protein